MQKKMKIENIKKDERQLENVNKSICKLSNKIYLIQRFFFLNEIIKYKVQIYRMHFEITLFKRHITFLNKLFPLICKT